MEVEVLWDTRGKAWELLNTIKADDPVTVSKYAEKNGLINQPFHQEEEEIFEVVLASISGKTTKMASL